MSLMPRQPDADLVAIAALLDRIFRGGSSRFRRTETGVSTPVYRVWRGDDVFYLRLAEAREDSLAPEVVVHMRLREVGVRVPEVVFFEPFDERLQRSAILTSEIPGTPVAALSRAADTRTILLEAGRDLATTNSLPVEGFGWIKRDDHDVTRLRADHPTLRTWVFEYLEADLDVLRAGTLAEGEIAAIRMLLARFDASLDLVRAHLAHGDLDVTHIYQQGGRYTGIIDFGEIRGAQPLYDLAHFKLHDGDIVERPLLAELLAGYEEITQLPAGYEQELSFASLLIGVRALAHGIGRPYAAFLARRVRSLITALA
jgi:aminoglycoside phosphotransferase (APT) family kinase protein